MRHDTKDELKHGARVRLAHLRREAGTLAAKTQTPRDWRSVRYRKLSAKFPIACPGRAHDGAACLSSFDVDALPGRGVKYCDELQSARIDHSGWFTDEHCDATARGVVVPVSHSRFLIGYEWSSSGQFVVSCAELYEDEREAANAANDYAEAFAEMAREDSERFNAMRDAEDEREEAAEAARLAFMARNVSGEHREIARDALETLRTKRDALEAATKAFENGRE